MTAEVVASTAMSTGLNEVAHALSGPRSQELRFMIEEFHAVYADALDRGDVLAWPKFFTDDGVYRVVARDNEEAGLPLALMLCEGMGMLQDRAYAIAHTEMFAPRYVQHQISLTRVTGETILSASGGSCSVVTSTANYVVYETLIDEATRLLQVGKYRDTFVLDQERLLLKTRDCIFDTVMVPNCLVYPV